MRHLIPVVIVLALAAMGGCAPDYTANELMAFDLKTYPGYEFVLVTTSDFDRGLRTGQGWTRFQDARDYAIWRRPRPGYVEPVPGSTPHQP